MFVPVYLILLLVICFKKINKDKQNINQKYFYHSATYKSKKENFKISVVQDWYRYNA